MTCRVQQAKSHHAAGHARMGTSRRLTSLRRSVAALLIALALTLVGGGCVRFADRPVAGGAVEPGWIVLDGIKTRYVDRGQGPAVLLLHGFAASLDTWASISDELAPTRRVLALDLKGFGRSSRPEGDYSPGAQAKLVLALLDARGVERVDVVAHSWGSSVALALALMAPERVGRIALYDAWVFEEQLPPFFLWARTPGLGELLFRLIYRERAEDRLDLAFFAPERIPQALVDHALAGIARPGTLAAHLAAVRGQRFGVVEPLYPRIQQPVLLLWGREDRVTPLRYGERLLRTLPNAALHVYPRCGHFPMIEARSQSTRDLVAFLAGGQP